MSHDHDQFGHIIPELLVGQGWCSKHRNTYPTGDGCSYCKLERSREKLPEVLRGVPMKFNAPEEPWYYNI